MSAMTPSDLSAVLRTPGPGRASGSMPGPGRPVDPHDSTVRADSLSDFRDIISTSFVPLMASGDAAHAFAATVKTAGADKAVFTHLQTNPHVVERTPATIAAGGSGYFKLNMLLTGSGLLVQDGKEVFVRPGDLALYDTSRPYTLVFEESVSNLVMMFPKDRVSLPSSLVEQLTAVSLGRECALGPMVTSLLKQVPTTITSLPMHTRAQVAQSGLDLLSALLSTVLDIEAAAQDPRQTQLEEVYRYIDAHLGADLTPGSIASAHFMSTRHLHSLFTGTETTVSALIKERRLEQCRSEILDPAHSQRTIGAIAAGCGFADPAHFSRVFKSRFGVSPSELRQTMAG